MCEDVMFLCESSPGISLVLMLLSKFCDKRDLHLVSVYPKVILKVLNFLDDGKINLCGEKIGQVQMNAICYKHCT